jgi:glutamate synthase (NADPH/NADH) small chain
MRYGIPEYRLPYDQLDVDIEYIKSLGTEIKTNTRVGKDVPMEELQNNFDAVFIATGLHLGRSTRIPGADHSNVFQSIDLLREVTSGNEIMVPEKVVVIGGRKCCDGHIPDYGPPSDEKVWKGWCYHNLP